MYMKEKAITFLSFCPFVVTAAVTGIGITIQTGTSHSTYPCLNGGKLQDLSCQCVNGNTGRNCESDTTTCVITPNPCLNGGAYIPDLETCLCNPPFTGNNCETENGHTIQNMIAQFTNSCLNGGTLQDSTCQCIPGNTGRNCETDLKLCVISPNPCWNGGAYIPDLEICMCIAPFEGNNCERRAPVKLTPCGDYQCKENETCGSYDKEYDHCVSEEENRKYILDLRKRLASC